jgi:hypothetical protein
MCTGWEKHEIYTEFWWENLLRSSDMENHKEDERIT